MENLYFLNLKSTVYIQEWFNDQEQVIVAHKWYILTKEIKIDKGSDFLQPFLMLKSFLKRLGFVDSGFMLVSDEVIIRLL